MKFAIANISLNEAGITALIANGNVITILTNFAEQATTEHGREWIAFAISNIACSNKERIALITNIEEKPNNNNKIKQLNRKQKQFLMVGADAILLPFALWISLSLRLSNLWPLQYWLSNWWGLLLIPLLSIPLFIHYGLYRAVLRYMGYQVIIATVKAVTLTSLCLGTLLMFVRDIYFPRSTIMIFWFVL